MPNLLPVHTWIIEDGEGAVGAGGTSDLDYTTSAFREGKPLNYRNIFTFSLRTWQIDNSTTDPKERTQKPVVYNLAMHVPPEEISFSYNQEIARNKVRKGWIIERLGEQLTVIEASGSTGAFYRQNQGLTRVDAAYSYGYTELQELMQIYRNNGMSYDPEHGVIDTIGEIILQYEGYIYRGSFEALTIEEDESDPYRFKYSFTFNVRGDHRTRVYGHYVTVANGKDKVSGRSLGFNKDDGDLMFNFFEQTDHPLTLDEAAKRVRRMTQEMTGQNDVPAQQVVAPGTGQEALIIDKNLANQIDQIGMILPPSYESSTQRDTTNHREILSSVMQAKRQRLHDKGAELGRSIIGSTVSRQAVAPEHYTEGRAGVGEANRKVTTQERLRAGEAT